MCNFASVARCIVREACGGEPNKLKWIRGRLVAPAFPGDALTIDIWKEKDVVLASVATGATLVTSSPAIPLPLCTPEWFKYPRIED